LGDLDKIWYIVSLINLLQNDVNIFHLALIVSLHYHVKLQMLITQVLQLRCQIKKLQNLWHLNYMYGLQIGQI